MFIIYAVILHILLLGSIFVIYFRSPVITGLQPQQAYTNQDLQAPAKRLVLIVTDGLRAESFFRNNCEDVPYLKRLMLQQGRVGISRTHVPTESRPGHIALIAGLYEDPSAVTRGWKENPIDFDTVFNRSAHTYAWGAHDVLHIFEKLADGIGNERKSLFDSYDHELDFSGKDKTYELDYWVFRHTEKFLNRKIAELREQTEVVFFLHLLGLDSAGHIHKPGSKLFLENLHRTDKGIWETVQLFNTLFPDQATAFILTADHGMTDAGSHGAGAAYETDTPFFIWGAGVLNRTLLQVHKTFTLDEEQLPLYELEQAQFASLMSALLGIPPPMNNFGILPRGFLNVSKAYEAQAAHSNALQLIEQFRKLCEQHNEGYFSKYLKSFAQLNLSQIESYERSVQQHFQEQNFGAALDESYKVMASALEGIDYYHSYYRNVLLLSTVATFLGWILYVLQMLVERPRKFPDTARRMQWKYYVFATVFLLCYLQRISIAIGCYILLPFLIWLFLLKPEKWTTMRAFQKHMPLPHLILYLCCTELLVLTFFERRYISIGFVLYAVYNNRASFASRQLRFYIWLLLVVGLSIFPLLPPSVGYNNSMLLFAGTLCTLARPFLVKSHVRRRAKVISVLALINALGCVYLHMHQSAVPLVLRLFSWCFLAYAFVADWLYKTTNMKQSIELIFLNFTTLYVYFCTSYESLFVVMLATELMLNLSMQNYANIVTLDGKPILQSSAGYLAQYFRLAFGVLFYTFFAFFGTGNIASVSSFDPNIVRCFMTTFSPFLIMALVILKLVIPVLLNIILIFGLSPLVRAYEREIFLCLLLICDIMGMNFLFLVRNQGSWLDIGSSISHFVIMEVTTLVLLLLTYLAKVMLHFNIHFAPIKLK